MDKKRVIALILAAAGLQCLAGCGKNKDDNMPIYAETPVETTTEPPVGGADISGDNYDSEAYQAKINDHIQAAELTDAALVLGSVGKDIISPEEGAEDSGLGTYRVSSSGVKLYYNTEGGKFYHTSPTCEAVNQEYWPLTGVFPIELLNSAQYAQLKPCKTCNAPQR